MVGPPPVAYSGEHGCANWGRMHPICWEGRKQSPVDIDTSKCASGKKSDLYIRKDAGDFTGEIKNDGNTCKLAVTLPPYDIDFEGQECSLVQFHFHHPSEHTLNGVLYDLELHLVHTIVGRDNHYCVVGIFFEVGEQESEFMRKVIDVIPKFYEPNNEVTLDLKPLNLGGPFYRYDGSLTTPPCSENVSWIVMQQRHVISRDQFYKYKNLFPHSTNRPVQPLFQRVITLCDQEDEHPRPHRRRKKVKKRKKIKVRKEVWLL